MHTHKPRSRPFTITMYCTDIAKYLKFNTRHVKARKIECFDIKYQDDWL